MMMFYTKHVQIMFMGAILQQAFSLTCYTCSSDVSVDDDEPFDPDCGNLQYQGHNEYSSSHNYCVIILWGNGAVSRDFYYSNTGNYDGECKQDSKGYWYECFCTVDLCNTDHLCGQCNFPWVPSTTTMEPTTSTQMTSAATTSTTSEPTTTTNSITTSTITTTEGTGLICYHCIDCAAIGDSTSVIQDSAFISCVSTVFLGSKEVFRGGSREPRPDGVCEQYQDVLSCWCSTDYCNNKTIAQLSEPIAEEH